MSQGAIRVVILWHMHQPFYKDLVTGEYRLPWVRLHALKDYYGMVKLLDEFPTVHQTFNLVPSLIAQIEEYAQGSAREPFLEIALRPASELTSEERRCALQYLFQANPTHMIGRYPRFQQLFEQYRGVGERPEKGERFFQNQDYTDLQVLSQIAWFDEFFLEDPEVAALARKGRGFGPDDQRLIARKQSECLKRVLPAYADAAQRGLIEISTSPFYHPILPLLCDTDEGAVSSPGLPLPSRRFRHPEDAGEQLRRGIDLHQRVFGMRPKGAWPSEGSVSEDVLAIAHKLGLNWMATDEGVLARSLGAAWISHGPGKIVEGAPEQLYTIYRYTKGATAMHLLFRDHALSDLIGFVYSGIDAKHAAEHLIQSIKSSVQPMVKKGLNAVVPIILDGENAWEYYPRSGREFLRRFYAGLAADPQIETLTVSEAIAKHERFANLPALVPGSWINANFNIWIGAPEDNKSWEHLSAARDFYEEHKAQAAQPNRDLAFEELLIAEGSDWNWWYGPEHHSANDREFDELYRKHLSNVYQALGAAPPDALAQPIASSVARPYFAPQTSFIHPRIDGDVIGYFDWIGAAMYTADRRSSAMHGKQFILDAVYAGIDEKSLYGRIDFIGEVPSEPIALSVLCECCEKGKPRRSLRLEVHLENGVITGWKLAPAEPSDAASGLELPGVVLRLRKIFEFQAPLAAFHATAGSQLRLRFSVWRDGLPMDALPLEGWVEVDVLAQEELEARLA